jgi:alpha-mannosidase
VQGRIGNADYTVGILNNSTYSYDCLNGLFRTVLIRSAPFARHQPSPTTYFDTNAWQDQGRQERRFWIVAGKGTYSQMSLDRRAEEFQTPAEYIVDSAHEGQEPWERSFLEILPSSVWILAAKKSEGGSDGTIDPWPGSFHSAQTVGVEDGSYTKSGGRKGGAPRGVTA